MSSKAVLHCASSASAAYGSPLGDDGEVTEMRRFLTASCCDLLFGLRGMQVAQFVTREFADRGPRQFIDEIERGGNLALVERGGQKCRQLVQHERILAGRRF